MGHYLDAFLLPISRVTPLEGRTIAEIIKIFGFDKWLNSPANIKIFNECPDVKEYLEKRFEECFSNKQEINIGDIYLLCEDVEFKFHYKIKLHPQLFYYVRFKTFSSQYNNVYMLTIEPRLAKRLPTIINGVKIVPGGLRSSSVITLETLQKTDLDDLRNSIDLSKDDYLSGREWALDGIIKVIKKAKKRRCDFF